MGHKCLVLQNPMKNHLGTEPEYGIGPVGGCLKTPRVEEVVDGLLDGCHPFTSENTRPATDSYFTMITNSVHAL